MKPTLTVFCTALLMIFLSVFTQGCVLYPDNGSGSGYGYSEGRRHIGTLEPTGPDVSVDGRQGRYGESISEGMTVRTGPRSSARIRYADGGFCQLDENTDPLFGIRVDKISGRECVYISIEIGQVFIDKNLHCFATPHVEGILNSRANLKVSRQETELAVFQGRAETYSPPGVLVGGQQLAVFSRGHLTQRPRDMRPKEATQIPAWLNWYDFTDRGHGSSLTGGWCYSEGEIFASSPQDCNRRGGFFSYDEREVREKYRRTGWCCSNGRVFETSSQDCERRKGFFSYNEKDVRDRCRRTGWCCSDGRVFETSSQDCERRKGFFSYNEKDVRDRCRRTGWCCSDGRVFETSSQDCERRKGFFSYNEKDVRKRCTPNLR